MEIRDIICAVMSCLSLVLLIAGAVLYCKKEIKPATFSLLGAVITAIMMLAISQFPSIMNTIDSITPHSCVNCGESYTPDNTHYCKNCGYEINPIKSTCECGKAYYMNDNATFCSDCGKELK
jgi:hypothetical protein